jgi:hypothetical protein
MTDITIENLKHLYEVDSGSRSNCDVRRLHLLDVLVDPNALTLQLPTRLIDQLELSQSPSSVGGANPQSGALQRFDPVRLTILGRDCVMEVMEISDEENPCVGRLPMLALDLVIDPISGRLTGNPAHDGEWVLELLAAMSPPSGLSRWSDDSALPETTRTLRRPRRACLGGADDSLLRTSISLTREQL